MEVKRTERGWPGHFCGAHSCLFRRNTLLDSGIQKVVVSTVGGYRVLEDYETLNASGAYYETCAFEAISDGHYNDADTSQEISFDSPWMVKDLSDDLGANNMHETVVEELMEKMYKGEID